MAKITVISKSQEIEGNIIDGKVTPFGTSGHISFPKAYIGRRVKVIVPDNNEMFWIFDEKTKMEFVDSCLEILKKEPDSRIKPMKKESIERINKDRFTLVDLLKCLDILKGTDNWKDVNLVTKIEKGYGLG